MNRPYSTSSNRPSFHRLLEVIKVKAAGRVFVVDIDAVVEIRGPEPLFTRCGSATVEIRKKDIPVVDLPAELGLTPYSTGCPAMLLLNRRGTMAGLAVDEVGEIVTIADGQIRLLSSDEADISRLCPIEVSFEGNFVPLLEISKL